MNEIDKQLTGVGQDIGEMLSRNYLIGSDRDNMLLAITHLLLMITDIHQDDMNESQQLRAISFLLTILDSTKQHEIGQRVLNSFCHMVAQLCEIVSMPEWDEVWFKVVIMYPRSYLSELYVGKNPTVKNCFVICA